MSFYLHPTATLHPTAIVESGVRIGESSSVWDNVHIRRDTQVGTHCIIGEKTHISYEVRIGNFVKINAFVYVCTAVTIEDGVMVSAGCVFTNDMYPRATSPDLACLRDSMPDERTLRTVVRCGATLGARCVIGAGLTIGRFAMVGMGAVVTRSVPDFHLVYGSPARAAGYVCRCGQPIVRFLPECEPLDVKAVCSDCGRHYHAYRGEITELLRESSSQRLVH